ncbi:MAG: hypothetical protein KJ720_18465 [Proteobacteria bacterium]|nr:hypothetical protein [Pseudomonadota bacterium]MBU1450902.1 hypothetical protein [Pseudomonadota bacterium]MBU2468721.1 hypothetical protein [Pseudomonadota bacterium]MBU2517173.1 hypothetical protein [Pseudomonadota bacterium]
MLRRSNPLNVLGISCWLAALSVFAVKYLPFPWVGLALDFLLLPALWLFCLLKMLRARQRAMLFYWWGWPSLPILLLPWAFMGRFLVGVLNYAP